MGQSKGSLHVISADLESLNDALRRIRDELDDLHGLRGASTFWAGKTFKGATVRVTDASGNLVHAWGTKE